MDKLTIDYENMNQLLEYFIEKMMNIVYLDLSSRKKWNDVKEYTLCFPKETRSYKTHRTEFYSSDTSDAKKILSILKFVNGILKSHTSIEYSYSFDNRFLEIYGTKQGEFRVRMKEEVKSGILFVSVTTVKKRVP